MEVKTMNISYQLYQAERTHGAAEQREIDASAGELAAAIAGLGRAGRRAVTRYQRTGHQGTKRAGRHTTPATVSPCIPCPR
jgi:hypothetical protein